MTYTGGVTVWVFLILAMGMGPVPASQPVSPPVVNPTVLLNNESGCVPLKRLEEGRIAVLLPQGGGLEAFGDQLSRYTAVDRFYWSEQPLGEQELRQIGAAYRTLIVATHVGAPGLDLLRSYLDAVRTDLEILWFAVGEGGQLQHLDAIRNPLLWTARADERSQRFAAMSVFGGLPCHAKLDADYSQRYREGAGFTTIRNRLSYVAGEHSTADVDLLNQSIDQLMQEAIEAKAIPGGVVMVVQDGNVLLEKAYGFHTYEQGQRTRAGDLFDLASITKIVATTPVVMYLYDADRLALDAQVGMFLPAVDREVISELTVQELLLHEAGLVPYIPFYRHLKEGDLSTDSSALHSVRIAEGRYLRTGYYEEEMWPAMLNARLRDRGTYRYSDVGMYILKEMVEQEGGSSLSALADSLFYRPLGMQFAGFLPRARMEAERIVPTEHDRMFRMQLLRGDVHDQGAAMAGGVAGHAGLFATANDLAIFGQMLLNRGQYGGRRYFNGETVDLFTSRQSEVSRRGLGFDRWDPRPGAYYPAEAASEATFGHTGFTGTAMWVDPEKRLIFIFLSNRVHPEVSSAWGDLAIRRRILDAVYGAIR